jgi:hypothetical protein
MRDPDVKGPFGRAWVLNTKTEVPEHQACLGSWLVRVPGAHPFWEHWLVSIIHLRDIPGVRPAHKRYPEAEFEFGIYSINPERCPEPDPDQAVTPGYPLLEPPDVIEQFHGISDRDAFRVAEAGISAILNGRISPDQDFRAMWKRLIMGTVDHFIAGAHREN